MIPVLGMFFNCNFFVLIDFFRKTRKTLQNKEIQENIRKIKKKSRVLEKETLYWLVF